MKMSRAEVRTSRAHSTFPPRPRPGGGRGRRRVAVATRHRPGLSKHMFEINNRCFVFRLYDQQAGRQVLLVVNGVDPAQAIPKSAASSGRPAWPSAPWYRRAAATTCTSSPGTRRSRRRSCSWSRAHPAHRERRQANEAADASRPGPRRSVSAISRPAGRRVVPRARARPTIRARRGGEDTASYMGRMLRFMFTNQKDPVDELWLHHVASQTVIGGENLTWYYPASALRGAPMMLKSMVKPDGWRSSPARKVADPRRWRLLAPDPVVAVPNADDLSRRPGTRSWATAARRSPRPSSAAASWTSSGRFRIRFPLPLALRGGEGRGEGGGALNQARGLADPSP